MVTIYILSLILLFSGLSFAEEPFGPVSEARSENLASNPKLVENSQLAVNPNAVEVSEPQLKFFLGSDSGTISGVGSGIGGVHGGGLGGVGSGIGGLHGGGLGGIGDLVGNFHNGNVGSCASCPLPIFPNCPDHGHKPDREKCPCVPLPKSFCESGATVPLYRYYKSKDHFYTVNYAELGGGKDGWVYEGVAARCYALPVDGTVPLYRFYKPTAGKTDHLYTTDINEIGLLANGYFFVGITCFISPVARTGTLPFYRYYSSSRTDSFYTTDFSELASAGPGCPYTLLGIVGYVCPLKTGDRPVRPVSGALG